MLVVGLTALVSSGLVLSCLVLTFMSCRVVFVCLPLSCGCVFCDHGRRLCVPGGAASGIANVHQDPDPVRLLPCTLLPAQQDHQGGREPRGGMFPYPAHSAAAVAEESS